MMIIVVEKPAFIPCNHDFFPVCVCLFWCDDKEKVVGSLDETKVKKKNQRACNFVQGGSHVPFPDEVSAADP